MHITKLSIRHQDCPGEITGKGSCSIYQGEMACAMSREKGPELCQGKWAMNYVRVNGHVVYIKGKCCAMSGEKGYVLCQGKWVMFIQDYMICNLCQGGEG